MKRLLLFFAFALAAWGQCGANGTVQSIGGGRKSCVPRVDFMTFGTVKLDATWGSLVFARAYTSGPVTVQATGFYWNNAAGALTFNLPSLASFDFTKYVAPQFCFRSLPTRTGAVTLQLPASTYMGVDGVNGTAAGTLVSAGALGDAVCVVAVSATQYVAYVSGGVWTNN